MCVCVSLFVQITFQNQIGKFDLEVTAFQMAVLFAWNQRPDERLSFEDIRYVIVCMMQSVRLKNWKSWSKL